MHVSSEAALSAFEPTAAAFPLACSNSQSLEALVKSELYKIRVSILANV